MSGIRIKNNINSEFEIAHSDGIGAVSVTSKDMAKINPVDTVAALRAMTYTPSTVWLSGYHEAGDGAFGSNIFRWNPESTEADNGGTVIKLESIATGRYELQYDEAVNVKWFGAVGDGVSNDTIAIQNAINSINYGFEVYIPKGFYMVSNLEIDKNLRLFGSGLSDVAKMASWNTGNPNNAFGGSTLIPIAGTSGYVITLSVNQAEIGDWEGHNQGVILENFSIIDDRSNNIGGIDARFTWHSTYNNLNFRGLKKGAISFAAIGRESNISNITTVYCGNFDSVDTSNNYGIFDFKNNSASTYPNNFNFSNILTVFSFGSSFNADSTVSSTIPSVNGLRIVNWYNHGFIASQDGIEFSMTQDQKDNLIIMNLLGVGNLSVSNSQLSIAGSYGVQLKLGRTTSNNISSNSSFSNCQFGGWYDNNLTARKSVIIDGGIHQFSNCNFIFAEEGAFNIKSGQCIISGSNVFPSSNVKLTSDSVGTLKSHAVLATEEVLSKGQNWNGVPYVDTDAVGTSAVASLYPDGTIKGSTSNGKYVKYPNGRLECFMNTTVDVNVAIDGMFRSNQINLTLPIPLVNVYRVGVSGVTKTLPNGFVSVESISMSTLSFRASSSRSATGIAAELYLNGEWK